MKENFSRTNEAEAHTKSQKASAVGNVRGLGDFFVLLKPLGIRILDKDVEHNQIFTGIAQNGVLHGTFAAGAIRDLGPKNALKIEKEWD